MAEASGAVEQAYRNPSVSASRQAYQRWVESTGVPIHKGYFVEDVRTVEVGPWDERECNAAFLTLAGQEGISEARVTEIPPQKTLPPVKFAMDEVVYVIEGRGLTTVWAGEGMPKKTFEWQKHSLFLLPRNSTHQFTNTQGNAPARLLHCNNLPAAMAMLPDPKFFFNNPFTDPEILYGQGDFYSTATTTPARNRFGAPSTIWHGNFFPDMRAWDKLDNYQGRGAGGHRVGIQFPNSPLWSHMSVFPSRTYKKAHRHGPGVVIVIPKGEGFSVMWPEGQDKVFIPWHEGSVFVPPDRWFHQHFNVGHDPARYLALHPVRPGSRFSERVEDMARDQIEYPEEDPIIRQHFAEELAKIGETSLMPEEAYRDPNYTWAYDDGED